MSNLIRLIFVFLILILLTFIYKKLNNQLIKKIFGFGTLIPPAKGEEYNPDINTKNWDLHKNRLIKFGRSQYKGLTFFVSTEDKIYYLSEDGNRVYC